MKQHKLWFIVPILIWMKPKEFVLPILHQSTGCSKITAIPNHWANGSNKSLIRVAVAFPVTHDSVAGFPDNSWEMVVQNYSSDRASINSCGMETKPSKKKCWQGLAIPQTTFQAKSWQESTERREVPRFTQPHDEHEGSITQSPLGEGSTLDRILHSLINPDSVWMLSDLFWRMSKISAKYPFSLMPRARAPTPPNSSRR